MKISNFLLFLGVGLTLATSGCLKDKGYDEMKYGIRISDNPAVSFPQSTSSPVSLSLNSSSSAQTITTDLSVESSSPATSDINVTLTADTVGFAAAGLTQLPTGTFSVALTQTIPVGKHISTVTVNFPNTTTLNPNLKYGLALNIATVSSGYQVATNMRRVVFGFSIKNKYDGHYRVTGTFVDVLNAAFTSVLPNECDLVTTGPNTVALYRTINGVATPGYLFSNAGAGTYYGNFAPIFTFDATDKLISVTNFYGQGTNTSSRFAFIDPTGTNQFNASANPKTLTAKYTMNQPNATTVRARFDETYTYVRAR